MKHSTKIWLLQVLWLFLSFHTLAVPKDFSGKNPSFYPNERLFEPDATLHVNAPPPPPITGDVSVCEGEVLVYTYPATPGYVYIWNVTNGSGTPSGNTFTVTWGNPGAGSITLIVKDANGTVVDTQTLPITIHSKPYPYITASFSPTCKVPKGEHNPRRDTTDCFVACDFSVVIYTAPLNPGSTYTWTVIGANSFTPSGNTVSVYWGAPGNGMIRVEETNAYGCTNSFEKCVEIIESPDAFFTSVPPAVGGVINICDGQSIQFYDASTGSVSSPLMDWFWDFGDGTTSTDKNPNHTFTAGTYQVVMYVENECHCKDSFVVTVNVSHDPVPVIECISTVCAGGVDDYHVDASIYGCPGAVYNWTVTGGIITSPMPYGPDIQVQWGTTGPGVVSLQILGCGGCPGVVSVVVSIISPTTTINGPNPACQFSNAIYSIPNMPGSIYTWTVSGGNIVAGQGTEQVDVNWFGGTSGTISVTYNNPTLHCSGSASMVVNLRPSFAIAGPNVVCNGTTGNYSATSGTPAENAAYQWTVTNSSNTVVATSSGSNIYNLGWTFGPGIYQITVTNSSGAFCNSPQSYFVTVYPAPPPPTFISGTSPVCPNSSYLYTSAPTVPGTFIDWTVINGAPASASGNNLTVTWGPSGLYILEVRQVSMTYPYCPSPPFIDTIDSKLPPPTFSILGDDTVCKNSIQNYIANSNYGDDYTWTITPSTYGSVISGQGTPNIQIQWNNDPGLATIGLAVTTCNVTTNTSLNVLLTNPPNPMITGLPSICENVPAPFSTTTSGSAFSWDFGDGSPLVSGAGPHTHIFTTPGTFNVTLTVTDPNGCLGQTSVVHLINVKPAPDAAITTPDPNAFCPGNPVLTNMYVSSLLQPGSYAEWYEVGTGFLTTGTSYPATTPGTYYAIVYNAFGCSTISNYITVTQLPSCTTCTIDPHVLNFNANKVACLTYDFTGVISGNGRILGWYFDDPYNGAGSTSLTPSHTYSEPGYYRVVFSGRFPRTGVPGDSCDRDTAMTVVIPIKAKFNYEITCGAPGSGTYNLNFNDLSTFVAPYTIGTWTWTFSGGVPAGSGSQNPAGIAFPPGAHSATLTITSGAYSCTITLPVNVPPIPNVTILAQDSSCQGNVVPFNTTAPGVTVNGWLWDFGDGATSALYPTTRTYDAPTVGSLLVTLVITDQFGCPRTFTKPIYIHPNVVSVSVTAASDTVFCAGDSVVLNSLVSPGALAPIGYLWSTVETTPSITASQTGAYYVEVEDARGCRNKSNIINVLVNPVPQAMIVGKDAYCYGETVQLSGYQGGTYTYSWLINGSPAGTGATYSQPFMPVGSYNFQIVITNTLNGCKDTSAIYPVIVRPLPPNPGISVSPTPACEGTAITLTGIPTVSPYTFTWSTGDNTNSIVVYNAGLYTLTITDQYGCESETSTQVYEQPDFSNLLVGCYEFCDTADVTLVGPVGIGFSYQWFFNGSPIPGPVGTSQNLIIPAGNSGIYNLKIVTSAGCSDYSADIEVNFIRCRDCHTEWMFKDIKCLIDSNGTQVYYFTLHLWNPYGAGATYSLSTPPGGTLSGLTPPSLAPGMNVISGFFIDPAPANDPLCISGTVYFGRQRCILKEICIPLPPCQDIKPCHVNSRWRNVLCMGRDANGNPKYYFEYNITWPGSNGSPIVLIQSADGTITSVSLADLNNGSNLLSGIFTDLAPHSGQFCFEMYVYDPATQKLCYIKDCVRLPDCPDDIGPCMVKVIGLKSIKCNGFDINGNQTYKIHFNVNNPFGSNSTLYFTSPDGGISNITPGNIPPGGNGVDVLFTNIPPASGVICITIIIVEDASGRTCTQQICINVPECRDDGFLTGLDANDEDQSGDNNIRVNPNPAKEQTEISYTFTKGTNRMITVTDMYGRTLKVFNVEDDKGTIMLQTGSYSPGVYMVTGLSDNKPVGSRRLIIIK